MRGSITQGKACKQKMATARGNVGKYLTCMVPCACCQARAGGNEVGHIKVQLQVSAALAVCSERFLVLDSFCQPELSPESGVQFSMICLKAGTKWVQRVVVDVRCSSCISNMRLCVCSAYAALCAQSGTSPLSYTH